MMSGKRLRNAGAAIFLILALCFSAGAQDKSKEAKTRNEAARKEEAGQLPAVIARDPGPASSLDLYYGEGGKEHAPDPNGTFTFEKEDMNGTNPKFDMRDSQGIRWKAKMGEESRAETAATRLVWAAGYLVDEDYFLPSVRVDDLPKLRRGEQYVSKDGVVEGVRLKRRPKDEKEAGTWKWTDNPFDGTAELNGLKVMMALINNWDLTTVNNEVYEVGGERHFVVKDLGASFGNTGNRFTRSKGVAEDYATAKFIEHVGPDRVDFAMHTRPFVLTAPEFVYFSTAARRGQITKNIPRADARRLGERLSQLSGSQIADCFRGTGFSAEEVQEYTKAVQERINELRAL
jgi:hypothetical protein